MTMCSSPGPNLAHAMGPARALALALAVAATALVACGEKKEKPATQTAAKVNKEEITVHQINFVLAQQRGIAARAGGLGEPADPRAPDRPGAHAAEGGRPEARPRSARRPADRGGAARDHLPRLPREDRRGRAQADAGRGQRVLRGASGAVQGAPRLQPPGSQHRGDAGAGRDAEEGARPAPRTCPRFRRLPEGEQLSLHRQRGGARGRAAAARERRPVRQDEGRSGDLQRSRRAARRSSTWRRRDRSRSPWSKATPAIEQFLLNERKRKLVADDLQALRGGSQDRVSWATSRPSGARTVQAAAGTRAAAGVEPAGDVACFRGAGRAAGRSPMPQPQVEAPTIDSRRRRCRARRSTKV